MFNVKYSKSDYLSSSLPKNRKSQFKDIFSTDFGTYFKIGLILLVFALPFLTLVIFGPYYLDYRRQLLVSNGASEEVIKDSLLIVNYVISLLKVLSLMIFSIGLSGVGRINREISFSNGVIFFKDYFKGVKQNFKTYMLISFIMGILLFFIELTTTTLLESASIEVTYLLAGVMYGVLFLVLLPTNMLILSSSTIYNLKFVHAFLNCVRFVLKNIFVCILFALLPIGLYYIQLINLFYIQASIYVLVILLIVPLFTEAWHLYALSRFDLYINKDNYPEIYLKGLYIENSEGEKHE